jgi:multiple sugar transport system permease protein
MKLWRHALLLVGALTVLGPIMWMITTSLKPANAVYTPPLLYPTTFRWGNYAQAWDAAPFGRYYLNSVVMTLGIVAGHVVFDAMAAYAFARLRFPLKSGIFFVFLATMLVPQFVTVIPAYALVASFGWLDTYWALIVPRLVDVFGIVLLRQYFATIPVELEEAARMDGAGRARIFLRLIVPLSGPALATLAMFSFLYAWNDFLWPLLVTDSDQLRTIQIGLASFQGRYGTRWNYLMAGTVTATLPCLVLFVIFQRALVRGIALTGLKD